MIKNIANFISKHVISWKKTFDRSITVKVCILIPTVCGLLAGFLEKDAGTAIVVAILTLVLAGPLCIVLGDHLSVPKADEQVPSPVKHPFSA